ESAVDGIEVGGRNLVLDSGKEIVVEGWQVPYDFLLHEIDEHVGKEVVVSLDVKHNEGNVLKSFDFYFAKNLAGIGGFHLFRNAVTNEWTRVHKVITLTQAMVDNVDSVRFRSDGYSGTDRFDLYIRKVQIEKGTNPTDWRPAS